MISAFVFLSSSPLPRELGDFQGFRIVVPIKELIGVPGVMMSAFKLLSLAGGKLNSFLNRSLVAISPRFSSAVGICIWCVFACSYNPTAGGFLWLSLLRSNGYEVLRLQLECKSKLDPCNMSCYLVLFTLYRKVGCFLFASAPLLKLLKGCFSLSYACFFCASSSFRRLVLLFFGVKSGYVPEGIRPWAWICWFRRSLMMNFGCLVDLG